jgi:hypothetical protein
MMYAGTSIRNGVALSLFRPNQARPWELLEHSLAFGHGSMDVERLL